MPSSASQAASACMSVGPFGTALFAVLEPPLEGAPVGSGGIVPSGKVMLKTKDPSVICPSSADCATQRTV
jgi:hypothetical protein